MQLTQALESRKDLIERYFVEKMSALHDPTISALSEAIAYSLSGGKRVRGFLVMEGAKIGGLKPEDVLPTAAAVEAFHAYSLVHDDLPSMDDASERRGRSTTHVQYDEATAVLVGDSLIPLGFRWICQEQAQGFRSESILQVMQVFSSVLGADFLTGGQHLDLKGATSKRDHWEIMRRKTAGLIQSSLVAGAILAEIDEAELRLLGEFGERLGLAYQLVDDLLDWEDDGYGELMGIEEVRYAARKLTREAVELLDVLGERADILRELTEYLAERTT